MSYYIETSAAVKLLAYEEETVALGVFLEANARSLVTASLTETEMRRAASREGIDQDRVTAILERFEIVNPDRAVYSHAGRLPGRYLRSLDAIHIAAAMAVSANAMVSYDSRQIDAAHTAGLRAISPA